MFKDKDNSIFFMKFFSAILILVVISSLFVVYASFQTRQLFSELQFLNYKILENENQKGQLLLEYSAWSSFPGVEKIARNELSMRDPTVKEIVFTSMDSQRLEFYGK